MSDKKNPSLVEGSDFSAKSTANTRQKSRERGSLGRKLVQELIDSGIPVRNQPLLNYKYVSKEEAFQLTGHKYSGIAILYTDLKGYPFTTSTGKQFYRLKPDAGQTDKGKYLTPANAGNRPYFSPLLREFKLVGNILGTSDLIITEGEKKTDCLVCNGYPTIGLAGVWSWKDKRTDGMLPELEDLPWRGRNVFILFDSDVVVKDSVKKALEALSKVLTSKGSKVRVVTLPHDLDGTKNGADDFIVKYGKEALDQLLHWARESHDKGKFIWKPEAEKSFDVAMTIAPVFKNIYAFNPSLGIYKWEKTRWKYSKRKLKDAISKPLYDWLKHMGWEKRDTSHINAVKDQLLAEIEQEEWNPRHLMSFKNGTYNNNKKEFYRGFHDRKHYLTHSFDYKYDEQAKCPIWIKFLNETFNGDQELIELLRASFRWTIVPKDIDRAFPMELLFNLHGLKGSGKGTTLEVLQALCGGKEACGTLRTNQLKSRNTLFYLISKKLAYDMDASGHISDAGILNNIITNEPVPVEKKYFDIDDARLGVVYWRAFNNNPTASGEAVEGLARRTVTYKFLQSAANPDPQLKNKLLAEIEGIFWWCWSMGDNKMFDVLKNRGSIKSFVDATIENLLDNQPVLQFICEIAGDSEEKYKASDLYSEYRDWCKNSGRHELTSTNFGKELGKMEGFVKKRKIGSNYYFISEFKKINLAQHFEIAIKGRLNPPSGKVANPNPPPSNLPPEQEKVKPMEGRDSSDHKNSFKNKNKNSNIKKNIEQTLQTLQPSIIEDQPATGSSWDTASDDEDPYWN